MWEWCLYFSTILHGQVSFYIASQPHPVQLLKDGMSLSPFSFLITMMETTLFLHMMHKLLKYSHTSSLSKKNTRTTGWFITYWDFESLHCTDHEACNSNTFLQKKKKKKLVTATRVGILFHARAVIENNSYYLINKSNEPTNFANIFHNY